MSVLRVVGAVVAPVVLAAAAVVAALPTEAAAATTKIAVAAAKVPCRATARACVKLSTNQAWLLRNGRVVTGPVRIQPRPSRVPHAAGHLPGVDQEPQPT